MSIGLNIRGETVAVNFDSPLAATPLKRIVDMCSGLWGDLEVLCGKDTAHIPAHDRERILMSALGSAAYLQDRVIPVCGEATEDARMYVLNMLDQTCHVCPHTPTCYKNDDRFSLLQTSLRDARKKLHHHLLQVNRSNASTSE